ncbi:hypothetical protein [uncultured Campylobacter sp.]|uniref:hypothetical protein n=1 Tax=uncultured Campylobacter sp. TaxID=218934 RepID=UPI00263657F5|nr:hypothetical protein [uncultured Campylobacter sp.]
MAIIDYERILNDFRDEVKDEIIANIVDIDCAKKFISYNIKAIKRRVSSEEVECVERYLAYKPDYIELDGYNNDILQRKSYFLKAKDGSYSNLALYFKIYIILKVAEKFGLLKDIQDLSIKFDGLWNNTLRKYASINDSIENKTCLFVRENKSIKNISIRILLYLKRYVKGKKIIKIFRELENMPSYQIINDDITNLDYTRPNFLDKYKIPLYLLPYYIIYAVIKISANSSDDIFCELRSIAIDYIRFGEVR